MRDVTATDMNGVRTAPALRVLLVCDAPLHRIGHVANVHFDHIRAFDVYSRHDVTIVSQPGGIPDGLDLTSFDAVIIHWSIFFVQESYFSPAATAKLVAFKGVKAMFIQDEYRQLDRLYRKCRETGLDIIFTCTDERVREQFYPARELPGVTKVGVLTGYVPPALCLRPVLPLKQRPIDLFYRGRRVPFWLGRIGQEKAEIATRLVRAAQDTQLHVDLDADESARLYGESWIAAIANARAVLGVESASSMLDIDGSLQRRVEGFLQAHPLASFDECEAACFPNRDGEAVLQVISPRIFEAAALRTPMVLVEGDYSGRLIPNRHYIPLKRDFSNANNVLERLRHLDDLEAMAERCYRDVALAEYNSYAHHVELVDRTLTVETARRSKRANADRPSSLSSDATRQMHIAFGWPLSLRTASATGNQAHLAAATLPLGVPLPQWSSSRWIKIGTVMRRHVLLPIWTALPLSARQLMKRRITSLLHRLGWT